MKGYKIDFTSSTITITRTSQNPSAAAASPYPADKKNAPRATKSPWSNPEGRQIK